MAYTGTGTQADPYIVNDWDDFVTLFNKSGTTDRYIHFDPDDPNKVIDLRKRIYDDKTILISGASGDYEHVTYIYGNDWTILGLSLFNSRLLDYESARSEYRSYWYNLNFKNFYILRSRNSYCGLITSVGSTYMIQGGFYDCKFSGVMDNSSYSNYSISGCVLFGNVNRQCKCGLEIKRCSFNIKLTMYTSIFGNCNDSYQNQIDNCLFHLEGHTSDLWDQNNVNYIIATVGRAKFRFCKFEGRLIFQHKQTGSNYPYFIMATDSCYNVFDIEIIKHYYNTTGGVCRVIFYNSTNSPNIINADKFYYPDNMGYNPINVLNGTFYDLTNEQMYDKQYLEDNCMFIVGDNPNI